MNVNEDDEIISYQYPGRHHERTLREAIYRGSAKLDLIVHAIKVSACTIEARNIRRTLASRTRRLHESLTVID
jgi:hypothetical protein